MAEEFEGNASQERKKEYWWGLRMGQLGACRAHALQLPPAHPQPY